jgi:WD40 repeat protein
MTGVQLLLIPTGYGSDTPTLAFNATGNQLVVGANAQSGKSSVGLVELEPSRGVQSLRGLDSIVRKVWIAPNSRRIAALSDDWSLAVWETESGHLLHLFEAPAGNLADNAGGAFDAEGKRFGFAAGTEARLYDLESGRTLEQWQLPQGFSDEVQFDAQSRLLLVRRERSRESLNDWGWVLYQLPAGRAATVLHQQVDFSYRVISMAFPPPASQFVAITKDRATGLNSVRAFEVASGDQSWQVEQHRNNAWDILRTIAGGRWCGFHVGIESKTQFVRTADGVPTLVVPEYCLAISSDGRHYATLGNKVRQWILRCADGSESPITLASDAQFISDAMVFSPDGRHVGCGTLDGTLFLAEISAVRQRLSTLRR